MENDRRRAIHADLIRESKDNKGYFRYNITIRETDGTEHIVPAYGKDLQDAIERLIWIERVEKITKPKAVTIIFAIILFSIIVLSGVLGVINNNPLWVAGGLGVCVISLLLTNLVDNYLNKK